MSQARPWSGTQLKIESLIFPLQLMPWHFPSGCEQEECNSFGVRARCGRLRGTPGSPNTQSSYLIPRDGNRCQAKSQTLGFSLVSEALLMELKRKPSSSRPDTAATAPLALPAPSATHAPAWPPHSSFRSVFHLDCSSFIDLLILVIPILLINS